MSGLFSFNFRSVSPKLLLCLGLAAFTLALGVRSAQAAGGSIDVEETAISAGGFHMLAEGGRQRALLGLQLLRAGIAGAR